MTGYTVHTGSNDKFRDGWDRVFQSQKKSASSKKKSAKKAGKETGTASQARKK